MVKNDEKYRFLSYTYNVHNFFIDDGYNGQYIFRKTYRI